MKMPEDQSIICKVSAYNDNNGVFNIYFKDAEDNVVCSYDPKKQGDKGDSLTIEADDQIIGVYGTYASMSCKVFSSLGLLVLNRKFD